MMLWKSVVMVGGGDYVNCRCRKCFHRAVEEGRRGWSYMESTLKGSRLRFAR